MQCRAHSSSSPCTGRRGLGACRGQCVRGKTRACHRRDNMTSWPLYEVFIRGKRGLNHVHVGSLHAADDTMALHNARDLYTRRNEGVSIGVVKSADITASSPDEKDPFFGPNGDKVYRQPTFYQIPDDVP